MKRIALKGEARLEWARARDKAAQAVSRAVAKGLLPNLKTEEVKCLDCGNRAEVYDHRDYNKPLEVAPVCRSCNAMRGSNAPTFGAPANKPTCPACGLFTVLYRVRTKTFICRRCGHTWPKES